MPDLKSLEDVKKWLTGLYGEEGIIYRRKEGKYLDRADPVHFHNVIGFRPANYSPHSEQTRKRWKEEGPYVWTVLLEEELSDGKWFHVVTVYDGTHNDMISTLGIARYVPTEERAWELFAEFQ